MASSVEGEAIGNERLFAPANSHNGNTPYVANAPTRQLSELDAGDDGEGAVGDNEPDTALPPAQKTSARKQRQNAVSDTWFKDNVHTLIAERNKKGVHTAPDEIRSLKQLLEKQQSERIIGSPRDYQLELFERAKSRNTIAVLDTGSGKTLIAVLLLRHTIDQELEDRERGLVDKVALVYQQHGVLKANLDQETDLFCGQMGTDLWTKEKWDHHFKKNMVIVCTADVLHHCLFHAFIKMEQVNLLIFDEAHHAKKEHTYARIIRDFYQPLEKTSRLARIFGMTASPVDGEAGEDVRIKAMELEALLHSTIATASDLTLFQGKYNAKRTEPEIYRYVRGNFPFETAFFHELKARFSNTRDFEPLFHAAEAIGNHLGRWCSDEFWSFAFSDRAAKKMEARIQRRGQTVKSEKSIEVTDAELARLREAHEFVSAQRFPSPTLEQPLLSSKVLALMQILLSHFERPTEAKCLVFVEQRATARLLHRVAQHLGGPNCKSGVLTGTNSTNLDAIKYSHHQQAVTMLKFRSGTLNCLFATSVGEEGLDVPECNIVIRFDPCKTMIQYIQSRGRARKQNSKFVLLMNRDNEEEHDKMKSIVDAERVLQNFCQKLPADRLLDCEVEGGDSDKAFLRADPSYRFFVHPETGAKLTYDFALVVLAHFVSCLPHDDDDDLSLTYITTARSGKFICEVILPSKAPIQSAVGRLASRKSIARRSAAFEACILLLKGKYLDENLLPTYKKRLSAMRNALLALNVRSSNTYAMKMKPALWEAGRDDLPESYFLTVISLRQPWERPTRPFALLTRSQLPEIPVFPIYQTMGGRIDVECTSAKAGLHIDGVGMSNLTSFTLAIFRDIYNKTFEHAPLKMSYWIAPLHNSAKFTDPVIDWELVKRVALNDPAPWTMDMPGQQLLDKFLIDPYDGRRRLFTRCLATELKPSDPVPPGVAQGYRTDSIMEYSVRLYKKSRAGRTWNANQPVVQADKIQHRLNVLADPSEADQRAVTNCFVCPEPFKISQLPTDAITTGLIFPAIIHRVESYLIALEFAGEVGVCVTPALALEAITKDSDNTDEAQSEPVNFQRGMGNNYERLEFLGDCFLKTATTISLYVRHAKDDESFLHDDRMVMLCNDNLFTHARERQWEKYVRGLSFSRRTWYPHHITLLEGKGFKNQDQQAEVRQSLADKTIADICEAIIGAALMSHFTTGYADTSQFDEAVLAVTNLVKDANHPMTKWSDYNKAYTLPKYQIADSNAAQRDLAERIQKEHLYRFKYPRLLRSAFTHPSTPRGLENIPSYQRLEFLGDSLLDLTAVTYLFEAFPNKDPQWLTEHKMAMVSNRFLGAVCVKIGFYRHIRHSHAEVEHQIRTFIDDIEEAERQGNGARDYWTTVKDSPKCLADIVEAYVGAIFVDSEFNYAEVQRFFDEHIKWFFEDMTIYDAFAKNHPVTRLHRLLNEQMGCNDYRLMCHDYPSDDDRHRNSIAVCLIHEEVIAHAQSSGSKYAKIKSANRALNELEGMAPSDFRQKFKCDCKNDPDEPVQDEAEVLEERLGTAI